MKIVCARNREQIAREQAAYQERKAAKEAKNKAEYNAWKKDVNSITDAIETQVADALSAFTDLNLEIDASLYGFAEETIEVSILSNERHVHDEHKALSWSWTARLDKKSGEVKKESGSWSGLNAVTTEQIESLKQSAACLEVINSLDWKKMLNVAVPNYRDYTSGDFYEKDPDDGRNFKKELLEADIEEAMDAGLWIIGHGYKWYSSGADVCYKVLKETPSQYEVVEEWERYVLEGKADTGHSYRVKKETFFQLINNEVETLEV